MIIKNIIGIDYMEERIYVIQVPVDFINQMYISEEMSLIDWEKLLAEGWRHNGKMVFRSSHDFDEKDQLCRILPLRNLLKDLAFSKSQRKIFKKNQDLRHEIKPLHIDDTKHELFYKHIARFKHRVPLSIWDFVSIEKSRPFKTWELCVYKEDKLIACSFIDITKNSLSSTYAMFDTDESKRSLGIYTMILEMMFGQEKKKKYYYPGYAYETPSFFDYKKKFDNTEFYDWALQVWLPYDLLGTV
jgi:leucyl-tRNA---protein transferase